MRALAIVGLSASVVLWAVTAGAGPIPPSSVVFSLDDRPIGQLFQNLSAYLLTLPDFVESYHVTVVNIALLTDDNVEIEVLISGIRFLNAQVVINSGCPRNRACKAIRDGIIMADGADISGAIKPDAVVTEQAVNFPDGIGYSIEQA